jgi:hypothetical protein
MEMPAENSAMVEQIVGDDREFYAGSRAFHFAELMEF